MAHVDSERKARVVNKINETMKEMGVKLKFEAKVLCKRTTLKIQIYGCSEHLILNYIETAQNKLKEAIELECDSVSTYQDRILRAQNLSELNPLLFNLNKLDEYFSGQALNVVQAAKNALCSEYYTSNDMYSTYDVAYGFSLEIGGSRKGFTVLK